MWDPQRGWQDRHPGAQGGNVGCCRIMARPACAHACARTHAARMKTIAPQKVVPNRNHHCSADAVPMDSPGRLATRRRGAFASANIQTFVLTPKAKSPSWARKRPRAKFALTFTKVCTQRAAVIVLGSWDRERVCAERPHPVRGITHEGEADEVGRDLLTRGARVGHCLMTPRGGGMSWGPGPAPTPPPPTHIRKFSSEKKKKFIKEAGNLGLILGTQTFLPPPPPGGGGG